MLSLALGKLMGTVWGQLGSLALLFGFIRIVGRPLWDTLVISALGRRRSELSELIKQPDVLGTELTTLNNVNKAVTGLVLGVDAISELVKAHELAVRNELPRLSEELSVNSRVTESMEQAVSGLSNVLQDIHREMRAMAAEQGRLAGYVERSGEDRRNHNEPVSKERRTGEDRRNHG